MAKLQETCEGLVVNVKVIPRAKRDEIVGWQGDALKIRLNAPPIEGRANEALVKFLAKHLGIAAMNVEIVRGEISRHKVVRVRGLSITEFTTKLRV